jgi:hypothetical protein
MPEKKTASATRTAEDAKPEGLYPKLLLAQTTAQAVGKAGRNEAQHYNYAKAEDVIKEAQRALHAAELVAFIRPVEIEEREITSQQGSGGLFVIVKLELVIVDPDGERVADADFGTDRLVIPCRGTGTDYPGDKAYYKAMTGGAKYAYSAALGIPFTDDPEQDLAGAGGPRQAREPEASPAQKRLMTTLFRRAGIADEIAKATVQHFAGKPASKSGASQILDRIAGDLSPDEFKAEIEKLIDEAGARPEGNDLPGDVPPDEIGDPDEATQAALGLDGDPGPVE